jgi:hypothetical protein
MRELKERVLEELRARALTRAAARRAHGSTRARLAGRGCRQGAARATS